MLAFWTDGLLRSVKHRVVIPLSGDRKEERSGGRYSIAYFCHPARETRLVPVPGRVVETWIGEKNGEGRKKEESEVITAQEHLRRKLAGAYGWET